jgi:hypothetical protein
MSRWLRRWNWVGSQIAAKLAAGCGRGWPVTDRRPLRAVRVVPIADPPLLVCPNQRTYSATVQVENEPRAGARICA